MVVATGNRAVWCSVPWNTAFASSLQRSPLTLCKFCSNKKGDIKETLKNVLNGRVSRKPIGDVGTLSRPLSQYISVACTAITEVGCEVYFRVGCLRVYFRVLWILPILPIESVFIVYVCFLYYSPVYFPYCNFKIQHFRHFKSPKFLSKVGKHDMKWYPKHSQTHTIMEKHCL